MQEDKRMQSKFYKKMLAMMLASLVLVQHMAEQ